MSREEAIETLKLLKPNMRFDDSGWLYTKQALDMAIQALSQEPCDDAISREAVKKWVCKTCPDEAECQRDCDAIKGIDALPSVTQKSETVTEFADRCRECGAKYGKLLKHKSGKWIKLYMSDTGKVEYECSKCTWISELPHYYCPNCGAKMESEDKE